MRLKSAALFFALLGLAGCATPPPPVAQPAEPPAPPARVHDDPIDMRYAVRTSDWEAVKRLAVARPSLVEVIVEGGYRPLHLAARAGRTDVVKVLLEQKADANFRDQAKVDHQERKQRTALHLAALAELTNASQNADLVRLLLDAGADVAAGDSSHQTALYYAAQNGREKLVDLLLSRGARLYWHWYGDPWTAPRAAVVAGHTKVVAVMLKHGFTVNRSIEPEYPPLHLAAVYGQTATGQFLIDNGARVNGRSEAGRTALHYAASSGHVAFMQMLLKAGAEVLARDRDSETALHRAISGESSASVELLLKAAAEIEAQDRYGDTPLHYAVRQDDLAVLTLLLDNGAKVNSRNQNKKTPMAVLLQRSSYSQAFADLLERHGGKR